MLGLDLGEATANRVDEELGRWQRVGPVEAEEEVEVVVVEAIEEVGVPAEGSHGKGEGSKGVADVVVALTEGTLAVLPGLAPEDGGDNEEDVARGSGLWESSGQGKRRRRRGSRHWGEVMKGGGLQWGGGCRCWG